MERQEQLEEQTTQGEFIPKEIRKTLRIKEGSPLEIFTEKDGDIILKKYSPINELSNFGEEYVESLAATTGFISIYNRQRQRNCCCRNNKERMVRITNNRSN